MKSLYFIDFCGTLLKIQTYPAFINFLMRELSLTRKVLFYILFKTRVLLKLKKGFELYALKHLSLNTWLKLCSDFSDMLTNELSVKVLEEIKNYPQLKPVLLSGALFDYVAPTLSKLNLDWHIEAASMEVKNNRLTGFLSTDFIFGDKKRIAAEDLCCLKGIQIFDCYAIGDSEYDIPLLESVNKPKIVGNSDKTLIAKAESKKWDIV